MQGMMNCLISMILIPTMTDFGIRLKPVLSGRVTMTVMVVSMHHPGPLAPMVLLIFCSALMMLRVAI